MWTVRVSIVTRRTVGIVFRLALSKASSNLLVLDETWNFTSTSLKKIPVIPSLVVGMSHIRNVYGRKPTKFPLRLLFSHWGLSPYCLETRPPPPQSCSIQGGLLYVDTSLLLTLPGPCLKSIDTYTDPQFPLQLFPTPTSVRGEDPVSDRSIV